MRERGEGRDRSFSVVRERLQRRSERVESPRLRDLDDLEGLMTVERETVRKSTQCAMRDEIKEGVCSNSTPRPLRPVRVRARTVRRSRVWAPYPDLGTGTYDASYCTGHRSSTAGVRRAMPERSGTRLIVSSSFEMGLSRMRVARRFDTIYRKQYRMKSRTESIERALTRIL